MSILLGVLCFGLLTTLFLASLSGVIQMCRLMKNGASGVMIGGLGLCIFVPFTYMIGRFNLHVFNSYLM